MLGVQEILHLIGVPIVLVALLEQVLRPDDAVGLRHRVIKIGIAGVKPALVERPRIAGPISPRVFLGLELFPSLGLILVRRGGDDTKVAFVWFIALRHLIENGVVDVPAEAEPPHGARGQVKCRGHGILGPTGTDQCLHRAPGINRVEALASNVLRNRGHDGCLIVGLNDQDVDLGVLRTNARLHAAMTVGDVERAIPFLDDGRLDRAAGGDDAGE